MSDIELLNDGNFNLINGDLKFVDQDTEVPQLLRTRLRLFLGEWFADNSKGVPYFQKVLVKRPDPVEVDSVFKKEIAETPGVLEIDEIGLEFEGATRTLVLNGVFRTVNGLIDFSEEIQL